MNRFLEQPVQLLHPLELNCGNITDESNETELGMTKECNTNGKINPKASTLQPKQIAATIASIKRNDMIEVADI